MNIGLLICDHVPERFRHIAGGYREMFGELFRSHARQLRFRHFDACHGDLPAALDACDAYLCTGSRYSAYEALAWITALKRFVRRLRDAQTPFVGICFGHQVLAEALGGRVARDPKGWGVGVHGTQILRTEPWMRPQLPRCHLQYMHGDQVMTLPPESEVLASSEHCRVAMFRSGRSMLGIEGHPEFPASYNEALMRDRAERIGRDRVNAGLESVQRPTDGAAIAQWIVNFLVENARRDMD